MIYGSESDLPRDPQGRRFGKIIGEFSGATKGFYLGISYYDGVDSPSRACTMTRRRCSSWRVRGMKAASFVFRGQGNAFVFIRVIRAHSCNPWFHCL